MDKNLKTIIIFSIAAAVFLVAGVVGNFLLLGDCLNFNETNIKIGKEVWHVALADNDIEKRRGLVGCSDIPEKSGLYFSYDSFQDVSFWTRKMTMPIDIVWIANGRVVGIEKNVPPVDKHALEPVIYRPPQKINGVFEVEAGKTEQYGINIGTFITYIPSN